MSLRLTSYESDPYSLKLPEVPQVGDSQNSFSVLIGPNGTGKSKLLGAIARSYISELRLKGKPSKKSALRFSTRTPGRHLPQRTIAISNLVTDSFPFTYKQSGEYVYLGARQSGNSVMRGALANATRENIADNTYHPDRQLQLGPVFDKLRLNSDYVLQVALPKGAVGREGRDRIHAEVERQNKRGFTHPHSPLLEMRLDDRQIDRLTSRISKYCEQLHFRELDSKTSEDAAVELLNIGFEFDLRISDLARIGARAKVFTLEPVFTRERMQIKFDDLSTGEQLMLAMTSRLVANILPESLILIDEPEVGLHPNWQADYVPLLKEIVPHYFGCHFVIATHSPFIVADGTDLLVPDEGWGSFVPFGDPFYGRSVENLLYRVFGAGISGNSYVQDDLRRLLEAMARVTVPPLDTIRATYQRLANIAGPDTEQLNSVLDQAQTYIRSRSL